MNHPNPSTLPPILVDGLTKKFGDFVAVDHVSFQVESGQIFGWLGPNGAGKTTTIRMLLGLMTPSSGSSRIIGLDSNRQAKAVHACIGYMSQQFTLYNDLTPLENIRFYAMVHGLSNNELNQRQVELIRMAGLEGREKVRTGSLSGGWKQRLALGCAIVHKPPVVFLDEPTAGVDPISRRLFWELIYTMANQDGVTVLVTTHYMEEAELCHQVGFINQGRLIALDTPARLKESHMHGQVLEIRTSTPDLAMRALQNARLTGRLPLEEVALYGAQIHAVTVDHGDQVSTLRALLLEENITIQAIEPIAPTLEDVFISALKNQTVPNAIISA